MPKARRLGDIGSGHACHFPPTPAIAALGGVSVEKVHCAHGGYLCIAPACLTGRQNIDSSRSRNELLRTLGTWPSGWLDDGIDSFPANLQQAGG